MKSTTLVNPWDLLEKVEPGTMEVGSDLDDLLEDEIVEMTELAEKEGLPYVLGPSRTSTWFPVGVAVAVLFGDRTLRILEYLL